MVECYVTLGNTVPCTVLHDLVFTDVSFDKVKLKFYYSEQEKSIWSVLTIMAWW